MYLIADATKDWDGAKEGIGQDLQTLRRVITNLQQQVTDQAAQITALQTATGTTKPITIAPNGQVVLPGGGTPISVAVGGALSGNGMPVTPLSVNVDNVTVIVNTLNQLATATKIAGPIMVSTGIDGGRSAGPTWIAAAGGLAPGQGVIQAPLNTAVFGTSVTVAVRLRAAKAGVSVQARLYDATAAAPCPGTSAVITSTAWTLTVFTATLTAGTDYYELNLLPGSANQDVFGSGFVVGA